MTDRITSTCTRPAALLLGAAIVMWPALALAAPPNDTCATATVIASLPFSDTPDAAGANSGLPSPTCDSSTDPNGRFDVWYQFTPGSNLTLVLNELSTNDTFQAIYTGTCGSLTQVACSDPESFSFAMTGGTTYYIRVGYWFSSGSPTGTYSINYDVPPPPPANDTCATATVIAPGSLPYSNTVNATTAGHDTPDATCNQGTTQRYAIWYSFTPSVTASYILSETSSNDTIRAVWTATDPNTPCTTLTQLRCDDAESVTFSMTAGTTYYISLAMWSSTTAPSGTYTLTLEQVPLPPANDTCATATVISSLPYSNTVDARAAGHDLPAASCDSSTDPNQRYAVWYSFTPSCTASYTLAETSTNDTIRAVWTVGDPNTPCTTLTQLRCDDAESATFTMNAGQLYYISLAMWSSTTAPTGTYTLTLDGGGIGVACNAATPSSVAQGGNTVLSATVSPACSPASTGIGVNVDLTNIGGGTTNAMLDDGVPPDAAAGDNIFTLQVTVAPATTLGAKSLLTTATDAQARSATCNMSVTVVPPPPANDECSGAIAIACGSSATVDNTGATTAASDPNFACRAVAVNQGSRSTWYTFVPTGTGAIIDTEGSVVTDTLLHVFSGTCGSLTVIGCDDDSGTGLLSSITVTGLTAGTTYYIEAANWSTSTTPGNIKVNVTCSTPIDVVCNAASPSTVLQGGSTVLTATVTPGSSPASTGIGVNVDLTNIGGGPTNAMLDDGNPPDAAIDGTYTLQATVNIATTPGVKSLLVTATDAQSRSDTCNISLTVTLPPPANDECAGAVSIACGGSATTDNSGATTAGSDPSFACRIGGAGQGAGSVWFSFVATQTSARVNTETSVVTDTLLHVFSGTCGSLTVIGCDDDGGTGLLSQVDVLGLTVGDTYYIEAACWDAATTRGNITVNVICPVPPPPPGDTCADAVVIASLPFSDTKDNSALTADGPPGSCNSGSATTMQNSMWYLWTAQRDGSHTLTVDPNGYDGIAAVLTGTCPSPATEIGCGDEPEPIVITWTASRCTKYYMQIGDWGVSAGGGSTDVSLTGPTPCPGDVDGDGDVDQDDLDLVLFNFGSGSAAPGDGDLDCDGDVDQDDLDLVLFNFATTCP